MKTNPVRLFALLAVSLLFVALVRADDAAYGQILKKREAILSEILAARESQYTTGATAGEAVWSARLALLSFRREIARSITEKMQQQELIVSGWEKRLANIEAKSKSGTVSRETLLLGTDSLLQAQQLFEELRLQLKKG